MKKTRSMIATLGMGILSVALAVFTNGCSCFFPCEKTESETPAVPVKAEQEKKACPKQQTVKKETEKTVKKTGEAVKKTVEAKKEEVKKAVETKAPDIAPTVSSVWTLELNTLKGAEKSWEEPAKNITLTRRKSRSPDAPESTATSVPRRLMKQKRHSKPERSASQEWRVPE